ncbi:MAG: hypothetical protein R3Y43_03585 [Alphaproteobacteria bacterium]
MRFALVLFCLISFDVYAQGVSLGNVELGNIFEMTSQNAENEGIKSFANTDRFGIKKEEKVVEEEPIMPEIKVSVSEIALDNIIDAEAVYCYNVDKRPKDYTGYTLNGFAVTGFCGIIDKTLQKKITTEFLRTPTNLLIDKKESCSIQPKAVIRFVRGVDHTDILISSPCFSYAVFYANKLKLFNAKPMQAFIKSLVSAFDKEKVEYVSPALYGQLVPVGVSPEKKEVVKNPVVLKEIPKPTGWNNLSF